MNLPFFADCHRGPQSLVLCFFAAFFGLFSDGECQTRGHSRLPVSATNTYQQTESHREGLIHLDVSVMNRQGEPVSGLSADKFTLIDNGVPQKLLSFRESGQATDENEKLTELVLLLDRLNLTPDQFESVKSDVIQFLKGNGGRLAQPVSVYWLSREGLRASINPTVNGNQLAAEVARNYAPRVIWRLNPPSSPDVTAVSDRYVLWEQSLRVLYSAAIERRDKPGRKALVWLGFGWPAIMDHPAQKDKDFYTLIEILTRLRESRLAVIQIPIWHDPQVYQFKYTNYIDGVRSPSVLEKSAPHFALPVLGYQSGGIVLNETGDVVRDIERCTRVASSFYTLSFDPPPTAQADEYHQIEVALEPPGLMARTVAGYYDQPAFYDQPRLPVKQVTVNELADTLSSNERVRDEDLASRLAGLKLTERLSSPRLATLINRLPGKKSKSALTALADESVFLAPPAEEIVSDPSPDRETQVRMLLLTARYVNSVTPKLPDFFAARTTLVYQQQSSEGGNFWKAAAADQSLKLVGNDAATLLYRQGHEVQERRRSRYKRAAEEKYLYFRGVFGPILGFVLRDATHNGSTMVWSRWESMNAKSAAVFRYRVHEPSPDYEVEMCCLRGGAVFRTRPQYYGELTIDPKTGAVLRLTMESEPGWIQEPNFRSVRPVLKTGVIIEYGPVEIGGKTFTCPLRSVVVMRSRTARGLSVFDERLDLYAPYELLLNDIAYTNYHKFGSESRILPDYVAPPNTSNSPK